MIPFPRYNPERETLEVWSVRDPYPAGSLEARQLGDMLAVASPVTGDLICAWIRFDLWTLPNGCTLPDVGTAFAYLDGQCRQRAVVDISAVPIVASSDMAAGFPVTVGRADGQLCLARADHKPFAFVVGVIPTPATSGFPSVPMRGAVSLSDWTASSGAPALLAGQPYFLAPAGGITSTPGMTPGLCLTRIGTALSPTVLVVRPSDPIQL